MIILLCLFFAVHAAVLLSHWILRSEWQYAAPAAVIVVSLCMTGAAFAGYVLTPSSRHTRDFSRIQLSAQVHQLDDAKPGAQHIFQAGSAGVTTQDVRRLKRAFSLTAAGQCERVQLLEACFVSSGVQVKRLDEETWGTAAAQDMRVLKL